MLALEPTHPGTDQNSFKKHKCFEFYVDVNEAIPTEMPDPRGESVDLRMHVNSDHAGDKATR